MHYNFYMCAEISGISETSLKV